MFKPAQLAAGTLVLSVSSIANVFTLDPMLYARLAVVLATPGDHTYLRLGTGVYAEVVKVTAIDAGTATVIVERAKDGTAALAFSAGTAVAYEFCSAAAADMLAAYPALNVNITSGGGVIVSNPSLNTYEISLTFTPTIASSNGTVTVTGTYPTWDLALNAASVGLCTTPVV